MNTKHLGTIGEITVTQQAMLRGYTVARVVGDNARYDLVIDVGGVLKRVQVKTVSPRNGKLETPLTTVYIDVTGTRKTNQYTKSEFDWLAIVDAITLMVYVVEFESIVGSKTFTLRVDPTKSNQTNKINWATDYVNW